ncbi:MAG: MBL fold metallo-hydrolase [Candidatus Thiodiazotropha endolucinida]|nr:MBL fold metallo-hydrolase [Candidatus Thiodiazotropha taylori]MCG8092412.1 MBL fold metallo-hydrolase [Candidatus Thiodiazotropha endolucinida]MCG8058497.1 MBL fold metallo-hydrolase [Candidatus Thiodiazotropha taylori]MCG8063080.1 MBL fold metallo-hydrolase [Candidatus Thiodiazotropha taylori]MCW4329159.1 MBL fold metallo-hydrolase [Candidatus Thiodiazotropha endolucinida]
MMRTPKLIALAVLVLIFAAASQSQASGPIQVDIYKGKIATVNSYIFSNGESLIVMDVQRATSEAKTLAEVIKAKGLPLTHILITHGHPDHYIGMDWLLKAFPAAKVVVANEEIKQDIIGFSTWMESVGWLDAEPALKPKSDKNPDGFDYQNNITVLKGTTLAFDGGGALKLETNYKPAESNHATTVYVEDLNSFFASDFAYNDIHLWMGTGVTDQHIRNWKDQLAAFVAKYGDSNPTVYPGHGDPTDISVFRTMIEYIEDFQRITATATSREDAMGEMVRRYPNYKEADFLLKNSVDFHVKE